MREDQLLQQAISAARAGHDLTARDMFLDIVKAHPRNETAWMWLTGLMDDLDDCIIACENVLSINPDNIHARKYLEQLRERQKKESAAGQAKAEEQARAAREALKSNDREVSLGLIRNLTKQKYVSADAWRMLAELSTDMNEQIHALEKLLEIAPNDAPAQNELRRIKHFHENPMDLASLYEEQGNIDMAIMTYKVAAVDPKFKKKWDDIYWKIISLERMKNERIRYVSPTVSIARLTFGPALLYLALLLVHVGVNPLAHPEPILWVGFFWVLLGGFMIAMATVRTHSRLWNLVFKNAGESGTPATRFMAALGGWILVLLPHIVLFFVAVLRLMEVGAY